jgi:hypothetical protein
MFRIGVKGPGLRVEGLKQNVCDYVGNDSKFENLKLRI